MNAGFDLSALTLCQMWLIVIAITIATIIVFTIYRKYIKIGVKALLTWDIDGINKLHKEHGTIETIFWTLMMFVVGYQTIKIIVLWIGVILWTFGIWNPHQ